MKKKLISNTALFAVVGVAFMTSFLFSACGKKGVSDDERLITRIENEEWEKCSDISPKTLYDPYFQSGDFAKRLILAGRVSSILEELEKSQERFLNTGDLIEIFPLVYFYETQNALETGMKTRIVHKTEYMELLIAGYDAYKYNRDAYDSGDREAVDRQWRAYFKSVEAAQAGGPGKWSPQAGVDVLGEGINAHLLSDLPRAIRYVVGQSKVNKAELERDFAASESFFAEAEAKAKDDVIKMLTSEADIAQAKQVFGNGSEFVAFARKKAWEMGVGGGPLGVLAEQPHFEHNADSRKFFPKELMDRGICR